MRGAHPSLYRSTASICRSYIVPPRTTMASAWSSGSWTTSHEPRPRSSNRPIRQSSAAMSAPRRRKRFNCAREMTPCRRTSGPRRAGRIGSKWISKSRSQIAELPLDEAHIPGARPFLGFLDREVDALAFPQQLEHRAPDGAAMKEMLEAGFIADEPEALVD